MTGPLSWRQYNPGAIKGQYWGATGTGPGGHAIYPDAMTGWNAFETQLGRYFGGQTFGKPLTKLKDIIPKWSGGDNPEGYVNFVANRLGISPEADVDWNDPAVRQDLMSAMASWEAGIPTWYGQNLGQENAAAMAGVPNAPAPPVPQGVMPPQPPVQGQPPMQQPPSQSPDSVSPLAQMLLDIPKQPEPFLGEIGMMGLGILANPAGGYASPMQGIASGMLKGMSMHESLMASRAGREKDILSSRLALAKSLGAGQDEYDHVQVDAFGRPWGYNKRSGVFEQMPVAGGPSGGDRFAKGYPIQGYDPATGQSYQGLSIPGYQAGAPGVRYAPGAPGTAPAPLEGGGPVPGPAPMQAPAGGPVGPQGPGGNIVMTPKTPSLPTAEEAQKMGNVAASMEQLGWLEDAIINDKIDLFNIEGQWKGLLSAPTGIGPMLRSGIEAAKGVPGKVGETAEALDVSPAEAEALARFESVSNVVLQAFRGAQVGPLEQARFERMLPKAGQSKQQMLANLRNVREAIELAHWYQRSARDPSFAINNPKPQVSKKVEEVFSRDENFMPKNEQQNRVYNPATGMFE